MFELSARAQDYVERTKQFIQNEIEPIETDFWHEVHELNQGGDWTKWQWPAQLETLKAKAKAAGLWNMFLPCPELGQGLCGSRVCSYCRTHRSESCCDPI